MTWKIGSFVPHVSWLYIVFTEFLGSNGVAWYITMCPPALPTLKVEEPHWSGRKSVLLVQLKEVLITKHFPFTLEGKNFLRV